MAKFTRSHPRKKTQNSKAGRSSVPLVPASTRRAASKEAQHAARGAVRQDKIAKDLLKVLQKAEAGGFNVSVQMDGKDVQVSIDQQRKGVRGWLNRAMKRIEKVHKAATSWPVAMGLAMILSVGSYFQGATDAVARQDPNYTPAPHEQVFTRETAQEVAGEMYKEGLGPIFGTLLDRAMRSGMREVAHEKGELSARQREAAAAATASRTAGLKGLKAEPLSGTMPLSADNKALP